MIFGRIRKLSHWATKRLCVVIRVEVERGMSDKVRLKVSESSASFFNVCVHLV